MKLSPFIMCVQYIGGLRGMLSPLGDIYFIGGYDEYVGGYNECTGGVQ